MLMKQGTVPFSWPVLLLTGTLLANTIAISAEFVPYPGKREVRLVDVEAPNLVVIQFDTDMIGFFRTLKIRVPNIDIPDDSQESPACEKALARKAREFTRHFLAQAKSIYVLDMRMKTSADEEAISPILTDQGDLAEALEKAGLARPDTVAQDKPWCL